MNISSKKTSQKKEGKSTKGEQRSSGKKSISVSAEGKSIRRKNPGLSLSPRKKIKRRSSSLAPPFPIVGIGASAGGLEAFTELLKHLPVDTGMGFVLVQHLAPNHESILPQILAKMTAMPVHEARHNVRVQPNCVYVIPPNASMQIDDCVLKIGPREKTQGRLRSIDFFLHSLAKDRCALAIGVILSGTDHDGTGGIEIIKSEGGITFAQDEKSAKFDSMPRSAAATGAVDFVLPPGKIGEELGRVAQSLLTVPQEKPSAKSTQQNESHIKKILDSIRQSRKVDFGLYKLNTVQRRITRRMVLNKIDDFAEYDHHLQKHPKELDALYHDILINVTSFFRDPEVFDLLKEKYFPQLIRSRSPDNPVRIWVAGCSTGQEAYSIAMAFLECVSTASSQIPLQIFATDLNENLLEQARHGSYTASQVQGISPERLRRFFVKEDGRFNICKPIRDICVFARHDIVNDSPFSRMDLVSCRNMLIYFEAALQQKVIPIFYYALNPNGLLLLGSSETVGEFSQFFTVENKSHKIYSKKISSGRPKIDLPGMHVSVQQTPVHQKVVKSASNEPNVNREADRVLLEKYAPAGVLVNSDLEVVQFRGSTSDYLEPMSGKASFHVLKMAREGLLMPLRAALHKAKKEGRPVRHEEITVRVRDKTEKISIEVIPIHVADELCFLILFESASRRALGKHRRDVESEVRRRIAGTGNAAFEIVRLQNELAAAKEYLQTSTEQQETINEELQASNEEAHSANEELQSINEELETTTEELESTNEELRTVNDEMGNRNTELHRLNSDLNNVLNGVQMCIVVLGRDLCIRRFTPLAERVLNLMPTDAGRPITNIKPNINFPDLEQFIVHAIEDVRVQNAEVQDKEGRWFSIRAVPYKTIDNKIDGAVLVLVDIDALKRSEGKIQAALDYAQSTIETVREPLLVLTHELRVESANRSFYKTFRLSPEEIGGRLLYELGDGEWNIPKLRTLLQEVLPKNTTFDDFEVTQDFERIGPRILLLNARRISDSGKLPERILLAIEDITERKNVELLRESEARYRTLAETLPQLVWTCPPDGQCDYFNSKWTEFTGVPVENLLGDQWRETMHPDDREETCDYWLKALKGTVPYDLEFRLRRADGQYHWFKTRAVPLLNKHGEIIKWFGTCTDIEDQKAAQELIQQSESWLRLIVESVKDFAIFTMDIEGRINSWNPGAQAMFGFSEEEAVGQFASLVFTPEDRASHIPEKELTTAAKNGSAPDEGWHLHKNGTRFYVSGVMRAIRNDRGELRGFTKVARDVTERKNHEEDLQHAHDELERKVLERTARLQETVHELEAFSYSVSHDMRAPLRAMMGFAQLIQEQYANALDDEGKNYLDRIFRSARRLDRLVLDVLTYSQAARAELELHPLNPESIIQEVIHDNPQFQSPQAEIKIERPLPKVIGHDASLMQCINNLLSNAVKFRLPEVLPRIIIRGEEKGEWARLWFEDNGIGIAASDVERIFSLFGRLHPTSQFEGTGIGLTIVRKAVERMGGRIGLESASGRGSKFWIELKRCKDA